MQKTKGISLIVLVITIIVMIILAGAIILTLNNSGIMDMASGAVKSTNEAQIRQIAQLEWTEAYLAGDGKASQSQLYNAVIEGLIEQNIDISPYEIIVTTSGVTVNRIPTIAEMEEEHQFKYYSTLSGAVADVNNGIIGTNANANKGEAVAAIYVEEGETTVVLLKSTTEDAGITVEKDMTINLGGNILTLNADIGIQGVSEVDMTLTIDGRITGSSVVVNSSGTANATFLGLGNNTFIVNGGTYYHNSNSDVLAETSVYNFCANPRAKAKLMNCEFNTNCTSQGNEEYEIETLGVAAVGDITIKNCKINVTSSAINTTAWGIVIGENSTAEVINSNINISGAPIELEAIGIWNGGIVTVTDCYVYTDAPNGSAEENCSLGIMNSGIATIVDSYVYGTHSGVQTYKGSKTYVKGGTFEGPSHGGFYFSHGSEGEAYIEGAKIARCEYKGAYENFTSVANGGLYVGAGSDEGNYMIVNFNNCEITNSYGPAIVLSSTYGGTNNTVRISNSNISTNSKVRIDSDTHKLFIGKGCNFTAADTNLPSVVFVEPNEVYTR